MLERLRLGRPCRYLRAEPSIKCGSALHANFILPYGVLCVMLYPIGVPLVYGVLLWQARKAPRGARKQTTPPLHDAAATSPPRPPRDAAATTPRPPRDLAASAARRFAAAATPATRVDCFRRC